MYFEMLAFLVIVALICVVCLGMIVSSTRKIRLSRQRRSAVRRWIQAEIPRVRKAQARATVENSF
jgi:hypothetical protein